MTNIVTVNDPKSPISEAYRNIRTNIEFSSIDSDLKAIVFTSSQPNEGKTTVISNLAVTFANLDKKVLIIDCDLRNPSIYKKFRISNMVGVTDVLLGRKDFNSCVQITNVNNLDILAGGEIPFNPSEILSSKKMKQFISEMKSIYDYVFIDAPPIGIVTDAGIISTYSDGVVMVVGSNEATIDLARLSIDRLNKVNANILGVVLNKLKIEKGNSTYGYYGYYYKQESGSRSSRNSKRKSKEEVINSCDLFGGEMIHMEWNFKIENMKNSHLFNAYKIRQSVLIMLDFLLITLANVISVNITLNYSQNYIDKMHTIYFVLVVYSIFSLLVIYYFKGYSSLWRYAEIDEVMATVKACLVNILTMFFIFSYMKCYIPLEFYFINYIMSVLFISGLRIGYRYVRRFRLRRNISSSVNRVLIIGGGCGGSMVINELYANPQLNKVPVAVIDDDKNKIGRVIHGVPILDSTNEIEAIVEKMQIDEIIFAIASVNKKRKNEILNICKNTKCKIRTIPGIYEIIDGKVDIKKFRDVDIEDLLGRDPIKVNLDNISTYIKGKVILITGGGGSIGSELCRQIASYNPKELIIVDIYENNAYEIQQELLRKYKNNINLKTIIASIRDIRRMDEVFKEYRPEVVFHAAAHKHVPLMEVSPGEAIKNNIFGTKNIAELANKYNVSRFVLISTDKAVNPTNIMGATKRAAEMIVQTMNENSKTEFVTVRFGNVLGSNGSVIPLFKKQIEEGGPVTITHPEIIRYFMTIPEAVQLVIQAGAMAKGGEIFVLDMGDPVKIVDLAKNLIKLSGLEPEVDIKIKYSGLRPGEKLYEELLMAEEGLIDTEHKKIFIGKPIRLNKEELINKLNILKEIVENENVDLIEDAIKNLVPTYIKENKNDKKVC